jgi:hypothetical protein
MSADMVLIIVSIIALCVGWALGRTGRKATPMPPECSAPDTYVEDTPTITKEQVQQIQSSFTYDPVTRRIVRRQ